MFAEEINFEIVSKADKKSFATKARRHKVIKIKFSSELFFCQTECPVRMKIFCLIEKFNF